MRLIIGIGATTVEGGDLALSEEKLPFDPLGRRSHREDRFLALPSPASAVRDLSSFIGLEKLVAINVVCCGEFSESRSECALMAYMCVRVFIKLYVR